MDYERIETKSTHQGTTGALSPRKLRNMLLGVEDKIKKKKHLDQEHDTAYSLRAQVSQIDDPGGCFSEDCKDVDVISIQPECTTSTTINDHKLIDKSLVKSTYKSQDNCYYEYDSGHDNTTMPSPMFEFQKTDRSQQRGPLSSLSKFTPSKWDEAQKWIGSPTSNRTGGGYPKGNVGSRKISRQTGAKVVVEVQDQRLVPFEEPDTKRIDCSQINMRNGCEVGWETDAYPIPNSYGKEIVVIDNCISDHSINLSRCDFSIPIHTTLATPPSTARPVSMRDMGTEMTPIPSQEPSRNGTPVRATTPTRSQTTSRSSTPQRVPPNTIGINKDLSDKELQIKTRREIVALGTQLGKTNIAKWASNEEEEMYISTISNVGGEEQAQGLIEARAAAWEEAEKAKYMARFKREEMKIQAWENHQKAKAEAEMRKMEVEVERMRGRAHDQLMSKLAATKHKAEAKRAAAEAKRNKKAARSEQQAESIRTTGHVPSSFPCCGCCI